MSIVCRVGLRNLVVVFLVSASIPFCPTVARAQTKRADDEPSHAVGSREEANANTSCSPLPTIDPAKDFFGNFTNSCYEIPMATSHGQNYDGDLNGTYYTVWYQVK